MPLVTIYLISLVEPGTLKALLRCIKDSNIEPLVLAKPIRWIIRPENINPAKLLNHRWDLLMITKDTPSSQQFFSNLISPQPPTSTPHPEFQIQEHFTLQTGIPSRLTDGFISTTNHSLLHPTSPSPPLTGSLTSEPLLQPSSQDLSLSPDLYSWIGTDPSTLPISGAISMLNLLSFKPGQKQNYLTYGRAFAETIGSKRGGNAKLVGNIVQPSSYATATPKQAEEKEGVWHEFALAHYPSLLHFADMLASKDYQEVNQRYRVPSLWDTCILCTSELEIERMMKELEAEKGFGKEECREGGRAKL